MIIQLKSKNHLGFVYPDEQVIEFYHWGMKRMFDYEGREVMYRKYKSRRYPLRFDNKLDPETYVDDSRLIYELKSFKTKEGKQVVFVSIPNLQDCLIEKTIPLSFSYILHEKRFNVWIEGRENYKEVKLSATIHSFESLTTFETIWFDKMSDNEKTKYVSFEKPKIVEYLERLEETRAVSSKTVDMLCRKRDNYLAQCTAVKLYVKDYWKKTISESPNIGRFLSYRDGHGSWGSAHSEGRVWVVTEREIFNFNGKPTIIMSYTDDDVIFAHETLDEVQILLVDKLYIGTRNKFCQEIEAHWSFQKTMYGEPSDMDTVLNNIVAVIDYEIGRSTEFATLVTRKLNEWDGVTKPVDEIYDWHE